MPKIVDVDERRQNLAAAAARVIGRSGVGAATVREVAAEAGLTTGALTHYFTDKRELLVFTLRASLEQRRAMVPTPAVEDAMVRLRALLVRALPTTEDARLHWMVTLAFCAEAASDEQLAAVQRDAYRWFRTEVASLLCEAGLQGTWPTIGDGVDEAERLIALTDGIALQALFDPSSWSADRQVAQLDAALARGAAAAALPAH